MKKYLLVLAMLLMPMTSAIVGYGDIDYGVHFISPTPAINYSTIDVNNSQYLQGYTPTTLKDWMQSFFDTIYCKLTGCDMTGDIDMGGNNIDEVLRVTYNTTGCEEDSIGGTTCWNPDDYTLNVVTGIDNTVIQVGQEVVGIGINKEGTFLPDGTIVSAVSAQGDRLTFIRADGSNISKSAMIGVLTHDCDANAQCMVTVFGTVRNVDTSMFTSGDKLYIDSNSPGNFTNITPTLPNNPTWVATVNVVHQQVGTVFVNPQIDPKDGFLINNVWATDGVYAENSINTSGYFDGQPINGALDSGVIWASEFDSIGNINLTHTTGLNLSYPDILVRLAKTDGTIKYCHIDGGTVTVPDDAHTVYYVDNNCAVQNVAINTYLNSDISPGGITEIFNVMAHSGDIEVHKGIYIQNKLNIKLRKNVFYTNHLKVSSGLEIRPETFPNFTIEAGTYSFVLDVASTTKQNESNGAMNELFYYNGTDWKYGTQHGINLTYCQDGVSEIAPCTNPTRYRRYTIYLTGFEDGIDTTKIHQEIADEDTSYANIAACLNVVDNPIVLNIPDLYEHSIVPLYSYCSRADSIDWDGDFIDLRAVKTGSISTDIDTTAFLLKDGSTSLTGNWNQGAFNLTNPDSWFMGISNSSDYWDNVDTFNTSQMQNNGGILNVLANGNDGEIQFNDNGYLKANNNFFWDNVNERLGIGTSSPDSKLDINGSITLQNGEYIENTINGTIRLGGTGPYKNLDGWLDVKFDSDSWNVRLKANPNAIIWESPLFTVSNVDMSLGTKNAGGIVYSDGAGAVNSLNIWVDDVSPPRGNNLALVSRGKRTADIGVPISSDPTFWFYGDESANNNKTGRLQYVSADDIFVIDSKTTPLVLNPSGSNVGIGTSSPNYKLQVDGDIAPETNATYDLGTSSLAWDNVFAVTYNDLTPAWTSKDGSALSAINKIKNKDDKIDHSSYPEKLRSKYYVVEVEGKTSKSIKVNESKSETKQKDFVAKKLNISLKEAENAEIQYTRDIGGTVTMIIEAVKELFDWNTKQDTRIKELEAENKLIKSELCKKDNTYSWCLMAK